MYTTVVALSLLFAQTEREAPPETAFAGFVVQINRVQRIVNLDEPDKIYSYSMIYVYTPAERSVNNSVGIHVVRVEEATPVKIGVEEGSSNNLKIGSGVEVFMKGSSVKKVIIMTYNRKKAPEKTSK